MNILLSTPDHFPVTPLPHIFLPFFFHPTFLPKNLVSWKMDINVNIR